MSTKDTPSFLKGGDGQQKLVPERIPHETKQRRVWNDRSKIKAAGKSKKGKREKTNWAKIL